MTTVVTCPDRVTQSLRYRSGFARLCAPESRRLPVYLDSAAFREAAGTAPPWSSYARYCAAIDLIRPDGAMARDVLDNQNASREGYDRLCRDGYRDAVIPVWQARPAWEADERTREMLERYGGLFPVTFGHCGYAGLCVRGTTRSFCIGCEYLIRRPEYLYRVDYLLESYTSTAEAHERMGDIAGARERRRLAAELRQLRHEMMLLAEAERQAAAPHWKALPSGDEG